MILEAAVFIVNISTGSGRAWDTLQCTPWEDGHWQLRPSRFHPVRTCFHLVHHVQKSFVECTMSSHNITNGCVAKIMINEPRQEQKLENTGIIKPFPPQQHHFYHYLQSPSTRTTMSEASSSKKRAKRVPFPQRLFHLLKLVEQNGWEDIISWVDDGTGFKVHDREKFEKLLLVKYFNTTRYASFTRQLHAYDFDCIRTGRQTGICKWNKICCVRIGLIWWSDLLLTPTLNC